MKRHTNNTKLLIREALKGLARFGEISFLSSAFFSSIKKPKPIHFVGLGNGGSNFVALFHSKGIQGKFTCVTDQQLTSFSNQINCIYYRSPGTSVFNKNGIEIMRSSDRNQKIEIPDSVFNIFKSNEKYVLLSGLGGYTGTFMTEELTLFLSQQKKSFLTIASIPFKFEGTNRRFYAQITEARLKYLNNVKFLDHESIELKYGDLTLNDLLQKANEEIYEIYKANSLS
jgi:cell division GTPase FtsZ